MNRTSTFAKAWLHCETEMHQLVGSSPFDLGLTCFRAERLRDQQSRAVRPRVKKRYVVTQELVITARKVFPPVGIFLGNEGRITTVVTTPEWFERANRAYSYSYPDMVQPYRGTVAKGSFVRVKQMFSLSHPTETTRYAKLDITDPETGATLSAYAVWGVIASALKEVGFKDSKRSGSAF